MKELSIEQKAKAYDEIIKKANKMHNENCGACKACLEELVPELREESEDERISKEIIEYIKTGTYHKSWIAWLEKQSKASKVEQAMREVEEKAKAFTKSHKGETSEEILAQMRGEQKPADKSDVSMSLDEAIAHCKEKSCGDNACALEHKQLEKWLTELKKLKEQKPAWSEEDEMFIHGLIRGLAAKRDIHGHTTFSSDCIDITETINWLESLKDRVQPQPKQKWSKEDEKILKDIITDVKFVQANSYKKIAWLKSLKDRVQPKQEWGTIDEKVATESIDMYESEVKELEDVKTKQEWSEEDEEIIEKCIGAIRHSCYSHSTKIKVEKFLESLRPQSQWKPSDSEIEKASQEWNSKASFSPFYMTKGNGVKRDVTTHGDSFKAGVKWVVKHLNIQSQWKPSDEEMTALNDVISSRDIKYDVLSELWKDLKKLMEE